MREDLEALLIIETMVRLIHTVSGAAPGSKRKVRRLLTFDSGVETEREQAKLLLKIFDATTDHVNYCKDNSDDLPTNH